MTQHSVYCRRLALFALALPVAALLLSGCGGLDALIGRREVNVLVEAFGLGPQHYVLLSDLTPTMKQGWYSDPVLMPLTINTSDYSDGIKAAVYGDEVRRGISRYHLGGRYSALALIFGVAADEPDSSSRATFRFFGDGREIMGAVGVPRADRRKFIIDVRGVQEFDLCAESQQQADGISYGSTLVGWADATLVKEAGIKHLVDLTATSQSGWNPPAAPGMVWINWRPYPHSIVGTLHRGQPTATVVYNLGGLYRKFSTVAGISVHETDTTATAKFEVIADGVARKAATVPHRAELPIQVDVTGVRTLELRAQVVSSVENDVDVGWGMALLLEQ